MKTCKTVNMLILAIFSIFSGLECRAQDEAVKKPLSFGFGYYRYVSGSGHGTGNVPVLLLEKGRSRFLLGPNFQSAHAHFSGGYASYEYAITAGNHGGELFMNGTVVYQHVAYLSRRFVEYESRLAYAYGTHAKEIENLRFRTVEYYFGFGLRHEIEESLTVFGMINVGGYSTLWRNYPEVLLYVRSPSAMCLMLGAGMTYQF